MAPQVQIFLRLPNQSQHTCVGCFSSTLTAAQLYSLLGIQSQHAYLSTEAGYPLRHCATPLQSMCQTNAIFVQLAGRIFGGKGGFGSMLRAQGGRMSSRRSNNTDACRDLSGRRLKTVKEAKILNDALEQIVRIEQDRQIAISKKIRLGLDPPELRTIRRTQFDDAQYEADRQNMLSALPTTNTLKDNLPFGPFIEDMKAPKKTNPTPLDRWNELSDSSSEGE